MKNYLEEIKNKVLKFLDGENVKVYLYGSQAKGTANFSSDVDIAVEFFGEVNLQKFLDLEEVFEESSIPHTVNFLLLNTAGDDIKNEVKSTGVLWTFNKKFLAEKALAKLSELATKKNLSEIERDSLILRFQFSFEIFWKCGKEFLQEEHGLIFSSPKKIVRAFRETGYFSDEETELLLQAADDRNLTAHIYDENKSCEIAERIEKYFPLLKKWLEIIKS